MRLLVYVKDGEAMPRWHRGVWYEHHARRLVGAPLLLHWPIRWARRWWEWTYRYRVSRLEKMLEEAELRGLQRSRLSGWCEGYDAGSVGAEQLVRGFLRGMCRDHNVPEEIPNYILERFRSLRMELRNLEIRRRKIDYEP